MSIPVLTGDRIITRRTLPDAADNLPADLHPVLRRIYLARHVTSVSELDRSLERLIPPTQLKGISEATALLADALQRQRRILIVSDFDADGATSCALAVRALKLMGAGDVRYIVPNRFEYGYGLTPEIVAVAAEQSPDLIITVDNGISSLEGVTEARRRGIDVLVTDHHLPGSTLPSATAIVNPNQPGDTFPSKNLAGVGVIFYVMLALRAHLRETEWFADRTEARAAGHGCPGSGFAQKNIPEPNLARLLDLVALGTVADVVPLDHNNRILVAQGLKRINQGHASSGIQALLRVAGRDPERITAMDLGYLVAPRLNAAGRLTDMALGIECLLSDDPLAAMEMARRLDELNRERRSIEAKMQEEALVALKNLHLEAVTLPKGLCLFDSAWHQGVIGLVAARIKERTHRPVIAFAQVSDVEIKGSARSVPGLHIRDALDAIAARHPHLLSKFGGHAMAAGLTLRLEHFEAFSAAFGEEVGRLLSDDDIQGKIVSDGELDAQDCALPLAETLRQAGPWGQGFAPPVFDGAFDVISQRVVGEKHLKMLLRPIQHNLTLDAIAFNVVHDDKPPVHSRIRAVYKLDVNEYLGKRSVQLVIEHFEPVKNS
jgi:single-stranded-DNA-specific exonuclease